MRKRNLFNLLKRVNRAGEILQCFKVTHQWWDLTRAYLHIKPLTYPYLFATRKGQKIYLNTEHDLITVWVIFCRQEYPVPLDAKVIIDAGANIGTFSVYASGFNAEKIIALEPFPETLQDLHKNIQVNALENKVEVIPCALASKSGTRQMDLQDGPSQSRGMLGTDADNGLEVKTQTLAEVINKAGPQVDLLKIDIEGGEHETFLATSPDVLNKIKNIAMEYHPNQPKAPLFKHIAGAQFQLTHDMIVGPNSGVATFKRL